MSDTPSGIFRRASETKISLSTIFQTVMSAMLAWLLTQMLGMDARVARLEAARPERDKAVDAMLARGEKEREEMRAANTRQWEAIRVLRDGKKAIREE